MRVGWIVVVVLAGSCGRDAERAADRPAVPQVTAWAPRPISGDIALRPNGASCDDLGGRACASGVCLHVGASRLADRICVARCGPGECDADSICRWLTADALSGVCVPMALEEGGRP